jgi:hypothetical protein
VFSENKRDRMDGLAPCDDDIKEEKLNIIDDNMNLLRE